MKYFLTLLSALIFVIQPAIADDHSLIPSDVQNEIGYGAVILMLLLFIVVMVVLLNTFKVLTKLVLKSQGYTEQQIIAEMKPAKAEKRLSGNIWNKLLSLKPLSEEKDLMMDHAYDGINELNNPIPGWFMYLFYGTIIFAVGYLLNYHVFKISPLQDDEYKTEIAQAAIAKKIYLSKTASLVDENTIKQVSDPVILASGGVIYMQSCSPCHGDHAQGSVGPNLTDDYWLHGGKINDVFKTVKYGVAAKGMPTWEKQLSPKQISDVSNFIKSLRGTSPINPKAPQGIKDIEGGEKQAKKV